MSIDNVTDRPLRLLRLHAHALQRCNRHRTRRQDQADDASGWCRLATIDGANDLGLADKTGSLTPGKRADLILVRTSALNMSTIGDPYDALVQLAQPSDVDTVVVDGRILRRKGEFTALDHEKVIREAADAVAALQARAKWPA